MTVKWIALVFGAEGHQKINVTASRVKRSVSDVQGERSLQGEGDHEDQLGSLIVDTANDSDSSGTGERGSATEQDGPNGTDIMPDHVIGPAGDEDDGTEGSVLREELSELAAEEGDADEASAPERTPE